MLPILLLVTLAPSEPSADDLDRWGAEALSRLREDLLLPGSGLYADSHEIGARPSGPAFCWGAGVLLPALNGAAAVDPACAGPLRAYADALSVYWNDTGPVPGFDVLPCPKPIDRYYDDNAWLVLGYLETYALLGDARDLERARGAMEYVLSGEDDVLGGGIYWRESDKASKNTCSNAPSAAGALAMYRATKEERYYEAGDRLLTWTLTHLQDPEDHLMWDNVRLDGSIERTKWSYNTALTIRALLLRAELSPDPEVRERDESLARVMAESAVARWVDPATGAIRDGSQFAHLLAEALVEVGDEEGSRPYAGLVARAMAFVHTSVRDAEGRYASDWGRPQEGPVTTVRLIDQASAARGFYVAARGLR